MVVGDTIGLAGLVRGLDGVVGWCSSAAGLHVGVVGAIQVSRGKLAGQLSAGLLGGGRRDDACTSVVAGEVDNLHCSSAVRKRSEGALRSCNESARRRTCRRHCESGRVDKSVW